jgi:stage II sporulation protein GA (sporulation sigma-E factor processing peptidase)
MNYVVLALIGIVRNKRVFTWKMLLAASIGGSFSVLVVIMGVGRISFFLFILYLIVGGTLLRLAFGKVSWREAILNNLLFFLLCNLVSGVLIYTSGIFGGSGMSMSKLLIVSILILFGTYKGMPYLTVKYHTLKYSYPVQIEYHGKSITGMGYLDTGNQLREPLSGCPVAVIGFRFVSELFSKEEIDLINQYPNGDGTEKKVFLHYIPFHSVGTEKGFLLGFKADRLKIGRDGNARIVSEPWLGIYQHEISSKGEYEMLLHEEFIR